MKGRFKVRLKQVAGYHSETGGVKWHKTDKEKTYKTKQETWA